MQGEQKAAAPCLHELIGPTFAHIVMTTDALIASLNT